MARRYWRTEEQTPTVHVYMAWTDAPVFHYHGRDPLLLCSWEADKPLASLVDQFCEALGAYFLNVFPSEEVNLWDALEQVCPPGEWPAVREQLILRAAQRMLP